MTDNYSQMTTTPSVMNGSAGTVFVTPGYMCPTHSSERCSFDAACNVYSIGIVMVEVVLGHLIGGQSSRNGKDSLRSV